MKNKYITTSYTLHGIDVEITGLPIPYSPAVTTLFNGDPGYPEEGGYAEDISVYLVKYDAQGQIVLRLDITDFVSDSDIKYISEEIIACACEEEEI